MFNILKKYPKLFVAFSRKADGSMKLLENIPSDHPNLHNRKAYLQKIGISSTQLISAEILHKNQMAVVSEKEAGKIIKGDDGLITKDKNIFLSITSADCLPIFLFELEQEIIGMIHAGWRSLEKDILTNAVGKIQELGGKTENILVGIGPAISRKHYEVGPEVTEKFKKYPEVIENKNDKFFLDIKKIAKLQLLELGILKENTEIIPECTFELPEKYFSARRDKKKEVEAMIAVIGLRSYS